VKHKLFEKPIVRYVLAGGTSYLVEMVILVTCRYGLGYSDLVSVGVSYWLGFVFSFFLQRSFAFRDKARSKREVSGQFLATVILLVLNYFFTLALVGILSGTYGVNIVIVRTLAVAIIAIWNYLFFQRLFSGPEETR
jgi:putative flippase GtrA